MLALDTGDEDSINDIIYHCDNIIQYGEHREADEKAYIHAESKLNGDAAEDNGYDGGEDGDY